MPILEWCSVCCIYLSPIKTSTKNQYNISAQRLLAGRLANIIMAESGSFRGLDHFVCVGFVWPLCPTYYLCGHKLVGGLWAWDTMTIPQVSPRHGSRPHTIYKLSPLPLPCPCYKKSFRILCQNYVTVINSQPLWVYIRNTNGLRANWSKS